MSKSYAAGFTAIPNQVRAWAFNATKHRPFAWLAIDWIYSKAKGSVAVITSTQLASALERQRGGRTAGGTLPCRRTLCRFLDDIEAAGIITRDRQQNTKDGVIRLTLKTWVSKHVQQLRDAVAKKGVSQGGVTGDSQRETSPERQRVSQGGVTPIKDGLPSEETRQRQAPAAQHETADQRRSRLRRLGFCAPRPA